MAKPPVKSTKKKIKKSFEFGRIYLNCNWNNTIVTLTDPEGHVLGWSSSGRNGFKGARQSTPYAGQVSAENVAEIAESYGIKNVDIFVKGMGQARDQALRGFLNKGLGVRSIANLSRLPHGGCRAKKVRKV